MCSYLLRTFCFARFPILLDWLRYFWPPPPLIPLPSIPAIMCCSVGMPGLYNYQATDGTSGVTSSMRLAGEMICLKCRTPSILHLCLGPGFSKTFSKAGIAYTESCVPGTPVPYLLQDVFANSLFWISPFNKFGSQQQHAVQTNSPWVIFSVILVGCWSLMVLMYWNPNKSGSMLCVLLNFMFSKKHGIKMDNTFHFSQRSKCLDQKIYLLFLYVWPIYVSHV